MTQDLHTLRPVEPTVVIHPTSHRWVDEPREAVAFYATRDTNPERWYPGAKFDDLPESLRGNVDVEIRPYHRKPGQRPALNDEEIDDIVAFLRTLTDGYAP